MNIVFLLYANTIVYSFVNFNFEVKINIAAMNIFITGFLQTFLFCM